MTSNNPLNLDAIEARANAATPGPWEEHADYGKDFYAYLGGPYLRGVGTLNFGDGNDAAADREFVKHARTDVDALLAEVRRLRTELADARANALREAADEAEGATGLFSDSDEGAAAAGALEGLAIRFRRMAAAAQPPAEETPAATERAQR